MANKKIFIVEDEIKIAELLSDYLSNASYDTVCWHEGSEAVPRIQASAPDLVILDLMLPGKDGLEICREIRQVSTIPIVMVTARVDEIDRLLGLELGADDYICKPFSPREVVVRVRNILRRVDSSPSKTKSIEDHQLSYRGIHLDSHKMLCSIDGQTVVLTGVEFRVLAGMLSQPGRVYTRQNLMDFAYLDRRVVSDRTIDSHVKNLRKKLNIDSNNEYIHSIYGVGYKVE